MRNARVALALAALARTASADHEHVAPARSHATDGITAQVGLLAASYRSRLYEGDYTGALAGVAWRYGRYELAARNAIYQIDRNGRTYRGLGDLMIHGAVTIVDGSRLAAGAHLMAMLPTGHEMKGLGMGHVMLMPAVWATWTPSALAIGGAVGYARGLGDAGVHDEHAGGGTWPLVDPMSFSEVTFDASAMYSLGRGVRSGVRVFGAFPLDDDVRALGSWRLAWRAGRVETIADVQVGLAGDPVRVRGVLTTAMRF